MTQDELESIWRSQRTPRVAVSRHGRPDGHVRQRGKRGEWLWRDERGILVTLDARAVHRLFPASAVELACPELGEVTPPLGTYFWR